MKAHIKQHRLFAVFVPAFVFACTAVGGYSFARSQSFDAIFNSFSSTILAGCALVLLTVLFALVIARAFSSIEGAPKAAHAPASLTEALRKHFLLYFAILIIAWLPVLIIHAPGTLAYDTLVQMMVGESLTEYYSAHNPPFDTWIFGLFWALGDFFGDRAWGVAAHSIFQAPLTAAAVAGAFCWLRLTNMPSAVRVLCMAIACALPWFPLAAETMSKDSLFSFFYLAWSVLFLETIRTRGAFLRKTPVLVLFFFATLFVALSKKTGLYVVVPSTLLALLVLRAQGIRLVIAALAAALVYVVAFETLFFAWAGIVPSNAREMYSVLIQQTARCALEHPGDATSEEDEALRAVFGDDWQTTLPQAYDPTLADPVKSLFSADATNEEKHAYFAAWTSQGMRHPFTYLEAFCANTYESVYPSAPLSQETEIPADWSTLEFAQSMTIYARDDVSAETLHQSFEDLRSFSFPEEIRNAYDSAVNALSQAPVVGILFSKALYAFWIPFFALFCCLYRRNSMGVIMLAPTALSFLALLAGPVSLPRYVLPELYTFMLVLGICWITTSNARQTQSFTEKPTAGQRRPKHARTSDYNEPVVRKRHTTPSLHASDTAPKRSFNQLRGGRS